MAVSKKTATSKAKGTASKTSSSSHPSWVEMIKKVVVNAAATLSTVILTPSPISDARTGVSRPQIKKYVETKYKIDLNPAASGQLNRAITSGSEKGVFFLPKGPSGKVKLAPKNRADASKEVSSRIPGCIVPHVLLTATYEQNTKPAAKKPAATATKAKATTTKSTTTKKSTARTSATKPKAKSTTAKSTTAAKAATTKKATTTTKKSGTTTAAKTPKKTLATTKKTAAAKKPASSTTKKATTAKKAAAAKKSTAKKPAAKAKTATKKADAKPAPKAKPASKSKPASKKSATATKV
ncbi:hypothetical protein VNI00_008244 [Paramarasmius palmivorus]|uniref:Histone H1 n=1 Tax=Paramarasmius palmivorus TaxID=297713 RepID=A0AAW0CYH7_9AGAR